MSENIKSVNAQPRFFERRDVVKLSPISRSRVQHPAIVGLCDRKAPFAIYLVSEWSRKMDWREIGSRPKDTPLADDVREYIESVNAQPRFFERRDVVKLNPISRS